MRGVTTPEVLVYGVLVLEIPPHLRSPRAATDRAWHEADRLSPRIALVHRAVVVLLRHRRGDSGARVRLVMSQLDLMRNNY